MRTRQPREMVRVACAGLAVLGLLAPALAGTSAAAADPPPGPGSVAPPAAPSDSRKPLVGVADALGPPLPAVPPPVDSSQADTGTWPAPDASYTPSIQCIRSGVGATPISQKPWGQDQLRINGAHKFATGTGQTVAVIDTGVHPHSQFTGKDGHNRLHADGDYVEGGIPHDQAGLKDCAGHGTEVAGIIGANNFQTGGPDGSIGFNGVAPEVDILSIRQTDQNFTYKSNDQGSQQITAGNLGTLAQAINWVVDNHDIPNGRVAAINISLTACVPASQVLDGNYRKVQAAAHKAVAAGIVVVAAAGNTAQNQAQGCTGNNDNPDPNKVSLIPIPPWFRDDVLSVAAVDENGNPAGFSVAGPWVSVAAPGTNIISLDPAGDSLVNLSIEPVSNSNAAIGGGGGGGGGGNQQQPGPIQGTSFAAPYVTGLVALVREKFPWLTAQQVMHRIEATAQHPAGPTGRNNQVGYGMINPVAALTAVVPGEPGPNGAIAAPIANARQVRPHLPPPAERNIAAITVALAGAGTGVAILLITLFVLHTVQRNKRRRGDLT